MTIANYVKEYQEKLDKLHEEYSKKINNTLLEEVEKRKLKIFIVPKELLFLFMNSECDCMALPVIKNIPRGAKVESIEVCQGCVNILITHPTFEIVEINGKVPSEDIYYEKENFFVRK